MVKEILDWLEGHIGLGGTLLFVFLVFLAYLALRSIVGLLGSVFSSKDDWGTKAGALKGQVHAIQKEYFDFKNDLSRQQKNIPENRRRLDSLQGRLRFAKKRREEHLSKRKKKRSKVFLAVVAISIATAVFVFLNKYADALHKSSENFI